MFSFIVRVIAILMEGSLNKIKALCGNGTFFFNIVNINIIVHTPMSKLDSSSYTYYCSTSSVSAVTGVHSGTAVVIHIEHTVSDFCSFVNELSV